MQFSANEPFGRACPKQGPPAPPGASTAKRYSRHVIIPRSLATAIASLASRSAADGEWFKPL